MDDDKLSDGDDEKPWAQKVEENNEKMSQQMKMEMENEERSLLIPDKPV